MSTQYEVCPFCGTNEHLSIGNYHNPPTNTYYVICASCFAYGPCRDTAQHAVESWNHRQSIATQENTHG